MNWFGSTFSPTVCTSDVRTSGVKFTCFAFSWYDMGSHVEVERNEHRRIEVEARDQPVPIEPVTCDDASKRTRSHASVAGEVTGRRFHSVARIEPLPKERYADVAARRVRTEHGRLSDGRCAREL